MPAIETQNVSKQPVMGKNGPSSKQLQPVPDLADYAKAYARQKPEVAALWCFGIGFVLGWKLKPW